jgi:hypothetical protein
MAATCVYFDGFHPQAQGAANKSNALSCWLGKWNPDSVAINTRLNAECLKARWRRFKATHLSLWEKPPDQLHVLAYSIGCHLAVRFLADWPVGESLKTLCLLAPDPKFRSTILDDADSAYEQAKDLWDSVGCPGDHLCLNLPKATTDVAIRVIASKDDPVAIWEGNAELMKRSCDERNYKHYGWSDAAVNQIIETEWGKLTLKPCEARRDHWIHTQLFTNWDPLT